MMHAGYDRAIVEFEGWSGADDCPHSIMDILRNVDYCGGPSDE